MDIEKELEGLVEEFNEGPKPDWDYEPMSDSQLIAQIQNEITRVDTTSWSLLAQQRITSTLQYSHALSVTYRNTDGASNVIMNYTTPAVDTLTTYMSKIFCSERETVDFLPTDPSLFGAAEQATKMVNAVIHKHNPGYKLLSGAFRDAAVNKNAVLKATWVEEEQAFERTFENISEEELSAIIEDKEAAGFECEIISQEQATLVEEVVQVDDLGVEFVEEVSHSVMNATIRCSRMLGGPRIDHLAPEEFVINEGATSINDSHLTRFVCHRRLTMLTDIQEMFPDVDAQLLSSDGQLMYDYETQARHIPDGTYQTFTQSTGREQTSMRELRESWILADREGTGTAKWWHVFSCGQTLLSAEEWYGDIPLVSFTYFPEPHKFYGMSVEDKLRDYERSATALLRSEVDAAVGRNTTRYIADPKAINLRDLQTVKNGIIRANPTFDPTKVLPVPQATAPGNTLQILEYIRQQVIAEIGIDPINGQISTDVEKSGNDAAKTAQVVENASAKIESYAREFADHTLRDLIWQIFTMLVENKDSDFVKELAESVTPGIPFIFGEESLSKAMNKSDLVARVGLGHKTGQQRVQAMGAIMGMIQTFATDPSAPLVIPPQAKLEIAYELAKGFGYENPQRLFGTPEEIAAQTQKADAEKQILLQTQQQAAEAQQAQLALQQQQVSAEIQLKQQQQLFSQQLEQQTHVLDMENIAAKNAKEQAMTDKTRTEAAKIQREIDLTYPPEAFVSEVKVSLNEGGEVPHIKVKD